MRFNLNETYVLRILDEAERRPTRSEAEFDDDTWGDREAGYELEAAEAKRRYFAKPRRKVPFI